MTDDPHVHYIIVRADLHIGVAAAMIAHAAGESAALFGGILPEHTRVVVLASPDEAHLAALFDAVRDVGSPRFVVGFRECEAPHAGALMSIGFVPMPRSEYRRRYRELTRGLPLF